MAMETHYIVQAFIKQGRKLAQGQVFKASDREHALRRLEKGIPSGAVGVIAFSQQHDPDSDEFGESHILGSVGQVPADIEEI